MSEDSERFTTRKVIIEQPSPAILEGLSPLSQECITRLMAHEKERIDLADVDHGQAISKLAAVLVLLYEQNSLLRVLLTTRSTTLRTHAGQTALPGGKVDHEDHDLVATAFREANEEVALPLQCPSIHTLCILEPFISAHRLLVTPVVALLTDVVVISRLVPHESEVSRIFDFPLEGVLDPEKILKHEPVVERGKDWFYPEDYHNNNDVPIEALQNRNYRMHRFRSKASPLKGLSADILIKTAEIAYDKLPLYERYAPEQVNGLKAILDVLKSPALPQQQFEQ